MNRTQVSIIIPTYNRENLIGETLDSIISQTFTNWECIIVDDRSLDHTIKIINSYCKKDDRIKLFVRPEGRLKGANACRNIGLELATGDYIVFFDSDDLMTPYHLEVKYNTILNHDCDFIIAQTRYFNNNDLNTVLETQYAFETREISLYNFVSHKVVWLTLDVFIKTSLAKAIKFNEQLQSGQEYNYFSKLLNKSLYCIYIHDVLSLRRHHDISIRGTLRKDSVQTSIGFFNTYWHTFQDLKGKAPKVILQFLLYRCYRLALKVPTASRPFKESLLKELIRYMPLKGVYYNLQILIKR